MICVINVDWQWHNTGPTFAEKVNRVEAMGEAGDSGTRETENNSRHQLTLLEHAYQADPDGCIRLRSVIIATCKKGGEGDILPCSASNKQNKDETHPSACSSAVQEYWPCSQ